MRQGAMKPFHVASLSGTQKNLFSTRLSESRRSTLKKIKADMDRDHSIKDRIVSSPLLPCLSPQPAAALQPSLTLLPPCMTFQSVSAVGVDPGEASAAAPVSRGCFAVPGRMGLFRLDCYLTTKADEAMSTNFNHPYASAYHLMCRVCCPRAWLCILSEEQLCH